MRPALIWLRTLVLLTTVLLTMGKAAWALEAVPDLDRVPTVSWTCEMDEPSHERGDTSEPERHTFSGGDDDRGELPVVHTPWLPSLSPDTHPAIPADLSPAHPWLSLPLRPPQH